MPNVTLPEGLDLLSRLGFNDYLLLGRGGESDLTAASLEWCGFYGGGSDDKVAELVVLPALRTVRAVHR